MQWIYPKKGGNLKSRDWTSLRGKMLKARKGKYHSVVFYMMTLSEKGNIINRIFDN